MHWMILPFKRYFDFEGRSRRMEYWMFVLFNIIISAVLAGPFVLAMFSSAMTLELDGASDEVVAEAMLNSMSGLGWAGISVYGLYALAVFIPNLAVTVRRLHDRNMSGWWYLGFALGGLLPFVGFIASLAFIVVLALPGTPGSNRFGPDPKDPFNEDVFA